MGASSFAKVLDTLFTSVAAHARRRPFHGIGKSMITSRAKSAKTSKSQKCERSLHPDQVATRLTYSLDELCKQITLENLHDLIDSGPPVGNEIA
jgi:hypothetical protein